MIVQVRWLTVLPAAIAGWYLALIIGLLAYSGVERLCPPDQMVSGACITPWFRYATGAVSALAAGLAAILVITLAALAAPTHRVIVIRSAFVAGLLVASYMLWQTSAAFEFVAALACGALTVAVLTRCVRAPRSPDNPIDRNALQAARPSLWTPSVEGTDLGEHG